MQKNSKIGNLRGDWQQHQRRNSLVLRKLEDITGYEAISINTKKLYRGRDENFSDGRGVSHSSQETPQNQPFFTHPEPATQMLHIWLGDNYHIRHPHGVAGSVLLLNTAYARKQSNSHH